MSRPRLQSLLICLLLIAAALAVYWPVSHYGYVDYDDFGDVSQNPHMRDGLTWKGVQWALFSTERANWMPLTRLSHLLDWKLYGASPGGHHTTNLLLHIGAALLLFGFLHRAAGRQWAAALTAFVFALHPLHVESVAWIAERKDVLCAFFWFAALWSWLVYVNRRSRLWYAVTLFLFACGLMAKPMIVTFPCLLLLLDYWPLQRGFSLRLLLEKIPFFVLSAADSAITVFSQGGGGAITSFREIGPLERIANALITCVVYAANMLWPSGLRVIYSFPVSIPAWQPILACIALAAVSVLAVSVRKSHPYVLIGWLWYLGTLAPVIGLMQVGMQARADRYTYVPGIGLCLMAFWTIAALLDRLPDRTGKPYIAVLAAGYCLAIAVAARAQTRYWASSEELFGRAVQEDPNNYVAWIALANVDSKAGRWEQSLAGFRTAVRIHPGYASAHNNLGIKLLDLGRTSEAIPELREALRIRPNSPDVQNALGVAFLNSGRLREAAEQFEAAVRLAPGVEKYHRSLGAALLREGRRAEGIEQYELAVQLDPSNAEAHHDLGVALSAAPGGLYEAILHFEQALRLDPGDVDSHVGLGAALARIPERRAEAIAHFETALSKRPDPAVESALRQLRGPPR